MVTRDERGRHVTGEPLGLGIVGVGTLTLRAILPHMTQDDVSDHVVVRALCDPVLDRASAAAERFGVPSAVANIDELLEREDVDLVTIVSPIGLHAEHAMKAVGAGKHVHINKTMTTTVEEADRLIDLASERDVRIVASPGEVLRPQISRTRELIDSGAIGQLSWAICGTAFGRYHEEESERGEGPGGAPIDPGWYFRKPGGGPLYDMGSYALHGLTSILGPAQHVTALSGRVVAERTFQGEPVRIDIDDNTILMLGFDHGVIGVVHGTAAGALIEDFGAPLIFGTEGEIRGLLLNGEPFEFSGRELTLGAPTWDWDTQMFVLPHVQGPHRSIPEAHVFEDIMQAVEWVRTGTPSAVNAQHARHVIDIIESAYRAVETGMQQELRTTFPFPP
jgi:predicted dehydrogenase